MEGKLENNEQSTEMGMTPGEPPTSPSAAENLPSNTEEVEAIPKMEQKDEGSTLVAIPEETQPEPPEIHVNKEDISNPEGAEGNAEKKSEESTDLVETVGEIQPEIAEENLISKTGAMEGIKMDKKEHSSYLMAIPGEIRETIYSKLSNEDALNLSCVSKEVKTDIETQFPFYIELDDRIPMGILTMQLNRKVGKCKVIQWIEPLENLPKFNYPACLRSFEVCLDGRISVTNFHSIMQECSPYLKYMTLEVPTNRENTGDATAPVQYIPYQYNFKNLKVFTLASQIILDVGNFDFYKEYFLNKNIALRMLGDVTSSTESLATFDVKLNSNYNFAPLSNAISHSLVSVICKNWSTLNRLRLHVDFTYSGHPLPDELASSPPAKETVFEKVNTNVLRNMKNLKEVDISIMECESMPIYGIIKTILHSQEKLKTLKYASCTIQKEWFIGIDEVIFRNRETLTYIHLEMNVEALTCIDFDVFEGCRILKTLKFLRYPLKCKNCLGFINIERFYLLPTSIEDLTIKDFAICALDMEAFFTYDLQSLKKISLDDCELEEYFRFGPYGVTYSILNKILSLPNILSLYIKKMYIFRQLWSWRDFVVVGRKLGIDFDVNCFKNRLNISWDRETIGHKWKISPTLCTNLVTARCNFPSINSYGGCFADMLCGNYDKLRSTYKNNREAVGPSPFPKKRSVHVETDREIN